MADEVRREWFEKDYYAVLGVSSEATQKDITKAYRKLARTHHPDTNKGDIAAEERFKEISAAYDVVGDTDKRAKYDEVRRLERTELRDRAHPAEDRLLLGLRAPPLRDVAVDHRLELLGRAHVFSVAR